MLCGEYCKGVCGCMVLLEMWCITLAATKRQEAHGIRMRTDLSESNFIKEGLAEVRFIDA
jgi:hypothetical protein